MIPSPIDNSPLIDFSLRIANQRQWKATVITRKEKQSLILHLQKFDGVEPLIIAPTKEWPDTLLRSEANWQEHNIVLLPDSHFQPITAIDKVWKLLLKGSDAAFAVFDVADFRTWGMVRQSGDQLMLAEKPAESMPHAKAWGFFGFHRRIGRPLLEALQRSAEDHLWKELPCRSEFIELEKFADWTREA